jgi:hypothetical protein
MYDRPEELLPQSESGRLSDAIKDLMTQPVTPRQRLAQAEAEGRAVMQTRRTGRFREREAGTIGIVRICSKYLDTDASDGTDWADI